MEDNVSLSSADKDRLIAEKHRIILKPVSNNVHHSSLEKHRIILKPVSNNVHHSSLATLYLYVYKMFFFFFLFLIMCVVFV